MLDKGICLVYYHNVENSESTGQTPSSPSGGLPKAVILLIVLLVIIGVGIGAYMKFGKDFLAKQQPAQTKIATEQPSPTSANVITSIKEALSGSQSLQCDFTDESGKKIMSYIKAGSVRTDITATDPKQSGSMIFKDKKMYYWNGKTGTVLTFDIQEMENITPPVTTPSVKQAENPQDIVASLEKYKESCKSASVSDSLFTPPADVKFTDLSSVMKSLKAVPSAIPSGLTEEQIKAMQEAVQQ